MPRAATGHSVAEAVRTYIDARPVVREAMEMGIVNLSALVRRIQDDTGIGGRDAVLTACRRYRPGVLDSGYGPAIHQALRGSRLEVRTHVGLLAYRASWPLVERLARAMNALRRNGERVHVLHGWEDVTVVADEALIEDLARRLQEEPLDRRDGLVELNLRSPDADVPGFLAATTTALAGRGINLVDAASCRQDHLYLIGKDDLPAAVEALEGLRGA